MKRYWLLLAWVFSGWAQGQDTAPTLRDPTVPNQELRDILLRYRGKGGAATSAAGVNSIKWPTISLLAKVINPDRPSAVMLKIEGRIVQMRPEQTQTVIIDGQLLSLKLVSVAPESVRLLLVERGETIFLP